MNKDWHRWVWLSLNENFRKFLIDETFKMPGVPNMKAGETADRYELRMLGPDYTPLSGSEWEITVLLNLAVVTALDPINPLKHQSRVGVGLTSLPKCIPIKKLGPFAGDNGLVIASFVIESDIKTSDLVPFDPVSQTTRSTLEATYVAHLDEGS